MIQLPAGSITRAAYGDLNAILGQDLADQELALTYDDGPEDQTLELATYLNEQGISATFFMIGKQAERRMDVVARVASLGHTIGNHTYTHPHLNTLEAPQVVEELMSTHKLLEPFFQQERLFIRPPYGSWKTDSLCAADPLNADPLLRRYVGPIYWNIGGQGGHERYSADWHCWGYSNLDHRQCGEGYLREISDKRRGIVLMHDNNNQGDRPDKTLQMSKWLIPQLKEQGYRFVTLEDIPQIAALMRQRP